MAESRKAAMLRKMIAEQDGKFFGVTFTKKDGSDRNMVARRGVRKGVKGTRPDATAKRNATLMANGMIGVYDVNKLPEDFDNLNAEEQAKVEKGAFRTINLETVKRLTIGGLDITVEPTDEQ